MPFGFIRRIARQSFKTTYVIGSSSAPVLSDNWTTEETTTYDANNPADSPAAWGGTVADLDRDFTQIGSAHAALGMLVTFINKPEAAGGVSGSLAGAVVKVTPTFAAGSACALELWSLLGSTWTKRRRVAVGTQVRSGDTVVFDLTGPVLASAQVDAYWITLVPDLGGETLSWVECHLYGICPNDPRTPDCPPGTPPEECGAPECGVDPTDWTCLDPPDEEPAVPDPFELPPILVKIPNPTSYTHISLGYFHNCPRPTEIRMYFGELPSGGSVKVTVAQANGVIFAEGFEQTISAPGTMTWTVLTGFHAQNAPATQALPPAAEAATTDFLFTRQLNASAFAAAGNLLDILTYFWTYDIGFIEVC